VMRWPCDELDWCYTHGRPCV